MNDQRSVTDQLRDAYALLNEHGLYDAADFCRRAVEDTDRRQAAHAEADAADSYPPPVTVPYPKGMSVSVEAPGVAITAGRDGLRITPNEGVHVTTVTYDATGYGKDTWKCSCGTVNDSHYGMYPTDLHVPEGHRQVVIDTYNSED